MAHLPPIVSDLAMILLVAGITTILFKKLNQPLVLGYIVAGFITGINEAALRKKLGDLLTEISKG